MQSSVFDVCVNPACKKSLQMQLAFCPYCGTAVPTALFVPQPAESEPSQPEPSQPEALQPEPAFEDAEAIYQRALAAWEGDRVKKNRKKAVRLFLEAAHAGNALAQNYLGFAYEQGEGVSQNFAEAARWYEAAAVQGNAIAQFNLGLMREHGKGIEEDKAEAAEWYRQSADQGDPDAQAALGYLYDAGLGVTKSDPDALRWYREAVKQGNARGQFLLGTMYEAGQGVEQNIDEAIGLYELAAAQGNQAAINKLEALQPSPLPPPVSPPTKPITTALQQPATKESSGCLTFFVGVVVVTVLLVLGIAAIGFFTKGSNKPPTKAEPKKSQSAPSTAKKNAGPSASEIQQTYDRAEALWYGRGVKENQVEAVRLYRIAAEAGHPGAQASLGLAYDLGKGGVAKSDQEALVWYRKSVKQKDRLGQYLLGTMYEDGQGVNKDLNEALRLYRLSAAQDYDPAVQKLRKLEAATAPPAAPPAPAAPTMSADEAYRLGGKNWNGDGVAKNEAEAVRLFRIAAMQGHAAAATDLGFAYEFGRGVTTNLGEAVRWYKAGAEGGNLIGQTNLGYMYDSGRGVNQDYAQAAYWYRRAANAGHARAQSNLGELYENGKGVQLDLNEAIRLYQLAARQGNEYARKALNRLGRSW